MSDEKFKPSVIQFAGGFFIIIAADGARSRNGLTDTSHLLGFKDEKLYISPFDRWSF